MGEVLYVHGVITQMLAIEAVRVAQEKFGKGKVMTGEQVRWGMENLKLDAARLKELGFDGVMQPFATSCANHMGSSSARVYAWDGKDWKYTSDWYQADKSVIDPLIKEHGDKYLADKKIARRTDCK